MSSKSRNSKTLKHMNRNDSNCDKSNGKMKHDFLEYGRKLLTNNCCNDESCDVLSGQLQNAQYSCNDIFGHKHSRADSKGNLPDTLCEELKNRKIVISTKAANYKKTMSKTGGKHGRRSIRKHTRRISKKHNRRSYSKK